MLKRAFALVTLAVAMASATTAHALYPYDYYDRYDVGYNDDGLYSDDWYYDYYDYAGADYDYEPWGYDYDYGRDAFGWEDDGVF